MKLTIFGANLRDQSKGQFVVHEATCQHCERLRHEHKFTDDFDSQQSVVETLYSDFFAEEGTTWDYYEDEVYFCPCCKDLPRERVQRHLGK